MELSKYEHVQAFSAQNPITGAPESDGGQRWLTKRRTDGKLFLCQEFLAGTFLRQVEGNVMSILHHPHLVNMVDVVWDYTDFNMGVDYAVYEHCDGGTLQNLLDYGPRKPKKQALPKPYLPESLCWHVLKGIGKALTWLHFGVKSHEVLRRDLSRDFDWQSIYIMRIEPDQIFFTTNGTGKWYGQVKLGNFQHAKISVAAGTDVQQPLGVFDERRCNPPEIKSQATPWSTRAEVFCLGAVIYTMMLGRPPQIEQSESGDLLIHILPTEYSSELRSLVRSMLDAEPTNRPEAERVVSLAQAGMSFWADKSEEGRTFKKQ